METMFLRKMKSGKMSNHHEVSQLYNLDFEITAKMEVVQRRDAIKYCIYECYEITVETILFLRRQ